MIDILCPILGRPPHGMLRSLEHSTVEKYEVYFICSPGDSMYELCQATGRPTWMVEWEPGAGDFAKKINFAFSNTNSPWCFTAADDVRFHPGWDRAALQAGTRVVGTNDLHSPAVQTGKHATHILFARSYIEECGGTFDGTGAVFCEQYDHQFVDNEFIATAKARGEWSFARDSVVEHLHPVWGKASWDATYEKAFRATAADTRLFTARSHKLQSRAK